jgi:hypothetical protein
MGSGAFRHAAPTFDVFSKSTFFQTDDSDCVLGFSYLHSDI